METEFTDLFYHVCLSTSLSISSPLYLLDLCSSSVLLSIPSFLSFLVIFIIIVYYLYIITIKTIINLDRLAYYSYTYFVFIELY